jgi:hypothetical protein
MKTWQMAVRSLTCGSCRQEIPVNSLVCAWTLPGLSRPKWRCPACADTPAPLTVPTAPSRLTLTFIDEDGIERPRPSPMVALQQMTADWKRRASGDAE